MKKIIREPLIYICLGMVLVTLLTPSENSFVEIILVPLIFLSQIIAVLFMLKNALNDKKCVKQGGDVADSSNIKRLDISMKMTLLALFGSLFALIVSCVMLLFLKKGDIEIFRYFILATSSIHLVIVAIAIRVFFKHIKK